MMNKYIFILLGLILTLAPVKGENLRNSVSVGYSLEMDGGKSGINVQAMGNNIVVDIDYFNRTTQNYMLGYKFDIDKVGVYPLLGVKRIPFENARMSIGTGVHWYIKKNIFTHAKLSTETVSIGIGIRL